MKDVIQHKLYTWNHTRQSKNELSTYTGIGLLKTFYNLKKHILYIIPQTTLHLGKALCKPANQRAITILFICTI